MRQKLKNKRALFLWCGMGVALATAMWIGSSDEKFLDFFDSYTASTISEPCPAQGMANQNTTEVTVCPSCRIGPGGGMSNTVGLFFLLLLLSLLTCVVILEICRRH